MIFDSTIYVLFLSLIFIIEAKLEFYVVSLKNGSVINYQELNRKEHLWSGIYAFMIYLYICKDIIINNDFWLLVSAFMARRVFFDFALKIFRSRKPRKRYEGDDWWVRNIFIPIFGKNGRLIELLVSLLLYISGFILNHFYG